MGTHPEAPTVVAGAECHSCIGAYSLGQANVLNDVAAWLDLLREDAGVDQAFCVFLSSLAMDVRSMKWLAYLRDRKPRG